eukprot:c2297_g1_i1.p1 GENE.c2297_g1_i1~~c2297_g1_i1.p1  ORF type:complete len:310 (-),score=63.47 c2297_g1_i1:647-1528(-)
MFERAYDIINLACLVLYFILLLIIAYSFYQGSHEGSFQREKKSFHILFLFIVLIRLSTFALDIVLTARSVRSSDTETSEIVLSIMQNVGSYSFAFGFFVFLLLWANVYQRARWSTARAPLRTRITKIFLGPVVVMLIFCSVLVLVPAVYHIVNHTASLGSVEPWAQLVEAALAIVCGIGFLYYGIRLLIVLREIMTTPRSKLLFQKILFASIICSLFFFLRAFMLVFAVVICRGQIGCRQSKLVPYQLSFYLGEGLTIASIIVLARTQPLSKNSLSTAYGFSQYGAADTAPNS